MAKIQLHYSLRLAQNVVKIIEEKLTRSEAKEMTIGSFSNGREQGLVIAYRPMGEYGAWRSVAIAQQRGSDAIIIYFGKKERFCETTNTPVAPTDWDNNRMFYGGDLAANFARDFLLTGRVGRK